MTTLADQFLADVGGASAPQGASAPTALQGLAAQFAADAAAAPSAPSKTVESAPTQRSTLAELGRQAGLTARWGATGLSAIPNMLGDAANTLINYGIRGVNSVADTHIPELQMPSQLTQQGLTAAGLPVPENATERIVGDVTSGMAGVAPSVAAGKALVSAAAPTARAIGAALQTAPGMQIAGAAGAGAGSGAAREAGLGPGWQLGGALLGGAAGVAGASAATAGVRALANRLAPAEPIPAAAAASRADAGVDRVISELGPQAQQTFGAVTGASPNATLDPVKAQVARLLQENPNLNAAAATRAADFRSLGMEPTLGQITRDPMQYAGELNMRGVRGVGDALTNRFSQQNSQLQQALNGLAGTPSDAYQAGKSIVSSLKAIDDGMASQVSDAYAAARASSGKNLDVPLTGVAQDYANVLNNFGDKVPSGVRNNFDQLGLLKGTQQKTFTIENAENLLKVINANRSNDPATNVALDQLNRSVKNAILSADDQGGVFAPARQLAAQRFALQDQIPALEAASSGSINADDFVRRFVTGGKTDQVTAMADLLRQHAPDAFSEARAQLGGQLALKAFGQDVAGNAPFKPTGYLSQMRAFGPAKLGAFYTPEEIAQLNAIGRVGAYMNAFPASAPVNTSNTASAIGSLLGGGLKKLPYVGGLIDNMQNRAFVNRALAADLANATTAPMTGTPTQQALGALLLNTTPRAPRAPSGNP